MKKTYNDWRLPTVQELLTLVNYQVMLPACNLKGIRSYPYWSSNTYAHNLNFAWFVNFKYGSSNWSCKSTRYYVICVRTTKEKKLQWSKITKEKMTWVEALKYARELKSEVYDNFDEQNGLKARWM